MKQLQNRFCSRAMAGAVILTALFCRNACADMPAPPKEQVTLHLKVDKERVYTCESVQVTVSLALHGAKARNVSYPRLPAVNGRQLSFTPLNETRENSDRYGFSAAFTPQTPGEQRIGPTEVSLELLEQTGGAAAFFGGIEAKPVVVKSEAILLTVLPLPAAGRPKIFSGAVGDFQMTVDPVLPAIHTGSPMTINSRIRGTGDLSTAACPNLEAPLVKSYPPRPYRTGDTLRCEQVIIPLAAGPLPPLKWSYFNPQQQRYITLSAPQPTVAPLEDQPTTKKVDPAQLVQNIPLSKEDAKINRPLALGTVMLLLAGGTALVLFQRKKLPPVATPPAKRPAELATLLLELDKVRDSGEVGIVYTLIHSILQQVIAARTDLPQQVICRLDVPPMRNEGELQLIAYLFMRCNLVRYGSHLPLPPEIQNDITLLKETVSSLKL